MAESVVEIGKSAQSSLVAEFAKGGSVRRVLFPANPFLPRHPEYENLALIQTLRATWLDSRHFSPRSRKARESEKWAIFLDGFLWVLGTACIDLICDHTIQSKALGD